MPPQNRQRTLILFLLAATTVISFSPVIHSDFINYDDPGYVTANPYVRSGLSFDTFVWAFKSTAETNWHPLTWLSHALDVTLFGVDPRFHHAMSLLLHVIGTLLLFIAFERMTGEIWKSGFVAFVFALHPLHVQSVAWIAERKDVLSGVFWALTLLAYGRYRRQPTDVRYLSTLGIFALGLLAKPMLVTLPFVLVLLDYWPFRHIRPFGTSEETTAHGRSAGILQSVREKIPFFALSLGSSVVTYLVQQQGRAMVDFLAIPFSERAANAVRSYGTYLLKTIVPVDLSVFYPHPTSALPIWEVLVAFVVLVAVSERAWRWRAKYPFVIVGWLWFLGTLVPVIGIVQVGFQAYADRYMYLPLIGLSILVAWGVPVVVARYSLHRNFLRSCFVASVLLMGIQTFVQAAYWQNSRLLLGHARAVTTGNYIADNNLAVDLADSGDHAGAITYLHEALRYDPNCIPAYHNLARSLLAVGATDEAVTCYDRITALGFSNPKMEAFAGSLLAREGKIRPAVEHYLASLRGNPSDVESRTQLAELYLMLGNPGEAQNQCAFILKLSPYNSRSHDILGKINASRLQWDEAARQFQEAIRCDSSNADAYNDFGILYDRVGNTTEAAQMFSAAVRKDSNNWNAQFNLGTSMARQNRFEEAEACWIRAAGLNPKAADVHFNLGRLFTMQNRIGDAAVQMKQALSIDSTNVQGHYNYGKLLLREGLRDSAAAEFATAIRLNPAFEPAQSALKKLGSR